MAKLSLTLLGGFQARLDTGEALGLPTRKAQALLAYLALPPGQAHPRDKLAALLWGGIREESARASLRQALFSIRKALGAVERDVLRQDGDALSLVPGAIEVDAAVFQQRVAEGTAFLLIHPGFGIATAWAYQQLAHFPAALNGSRGRAKRLIALLQTADLAAASAEFYNALEAPALKKYPLLAIYQDFLRAQGAAAVLMSGSGSTTFAIARSDSAARELEAKVKAKFGPCWTAVAPI